jgi:homoserine kinase
VVRVRVPASSANLGPGFDCFAAALGLFLELDVSEAEQFELVSELDVPHDRTNLAVAAFERILPASGYRFELRSQIPLSGGLGSSAAAIVAGLLAADRLSGGGGELLALATELEGHPDNVAAALEGGFVVCQGTRVHRFEPPMGLEAVLVVPHEAVVTEAARAALPGSVPLADAVFNVAEAATLILGLAGPDWDLIAAGLRDRLHQPHRAHLYPRSVELLEQATALGALGATISGAGPSVLVWCRYEQTGAVIEELARETEGWARVMRAPFESHGADVRGL